VRAAVGNEVHALSNHPYELPRHGVFAPTGARQGDAYCAIFIHVPAAWMAMIMLTGMLIMTFAAWFYAIAVVLVRVRAIILDRERGAAWIGATRR
jgi:hypothetical protein